MMPVRKARLERFEADRLQADDQAEDEDQVAGSDLQGIPQAGIDRGAREYALLQEAAGSTREEHQQDQEQYGLEKERRAHAQGADGDQRFLPEPQKTAAIGVQQAVDIVLLQVSAGHDQRREQEDRRDRFENRLG